MNIFTSIKPYIIECLTNLYAIDSSLIELQPTRKEFEGEVTLVIFPLIRLIKKSPEIIGEEIAQELQRINAPIISYNIVKGFLNLSVDTAVFISLCNELLATPSYGIQQPNENSPAVMVEYASPNTNKPLHLGHIRNILLGYSVSKIVEATGKKVYQTEVVNDRGIHICKSMLAWQKMGQGETPKSSGLKGDKLVGKYYVIFDTLYKEECQQLIANGRTEEEAKKEAPILLEAQEMLRKWEANDTEVVDLWKRMNEWVYEGFDITFKTLGIQFDFIDYESQTYLLGKDVVEENLAKGILYQAEDQSVWCDLSEEKLDNKLLLRGDGTSVYMTQDLGTAIKRHTEYPIEQLIYTVGNEQNHHFIVLFTILKKMGYDWANKLYHLSYGMVNLADGSRMKSREGTVVDADDLMDEMIQVAKEKSIEMGKLEQLSDEEKEKTYAIIGLGALKYFILKVDPKKTIKFDPTETIDFNGNTGPFIQYTYARIQSLLRNNIIEKSVSTEITLEDIEKELITTLADFQETVVLAANNLSPAIIANYTYELVKKYNTFYQNFPILKEENIEIQQFRLNLSYKVAEIIQSGMRLLGIEMPERM